MSDAETPKTTKAPKASAVDPADALKAAVEAAIAAAETYAAATNASPPAVTVGDYKVRFQGDELLSISRL